MTEPPPCSPWIAAPPRPSGDPTVHALGLMGLIGGAAVTALSGAAVLWAALVFAPSCVTDCGSNALGVAFAFLGIAAGVAAMLLGGLFVAIGRPRRPKR